MPGNTPDVGFAFGVEGDQSLIATIRQLRDEITKLKSAQDQLGPSSEKASRGFESMMGGSTEARHAIMLLGEETGVHVPRAVATLIARLGPLQGLLSAAFPIVGAVALIGIIAKVIERHEALAAAQRKLAHDTDDLAIKERDRTAGLQLENLKLEDQIAKVEGRPAKNRLAEALLESKIKADELASALDAIQAKSQETFEKQASFFTKLENIGKLALSYAGPERGSSEGAMAGEGQAGLQLGQDVKGVIAAYDEVQKARVKLNEVDPHAKDADKQEAAAVRDLAKAYKAYGKAAADAVAVAEAAGKHDVAAQLRQQQISAAQGAADMAELQKNAQLKRHVAGDDNSHDQFEVASRQLETDRAQIANDKAAAHDELEIFKATAQEREAADKESYDRGLITLAEYFQRRRETITTERDQEIAAFNRETAGLEGLLAKTEAVQAIPGSADDLSKQRSILEIKREIASLDGQIALAEIHASSQKEVVDRAQFESEQQHQKSRLEFEEKLAEAQGNSQRANQLKNELEDQQIRRDLEQLGYEKKVIDQLMAELASARNVRTTAQNAQQGFEGGVSAIDSKKSQLQEQVAAGTLQQYQAEQQLKEAYAQEIPVLQQKIELLRQQAALAPSKDLSDQLTKEANKDEATLNKMRTDMNQLGQEWKQTIKSAVESVGNDLTHGFNGWIQGQQTFAQAAKQTWNGIVMTALNAIETIGAKWITQHLLMKAFNALFHTEEVQQQGDAEAAKDAVTSSSDVAQASSYAAVAGAATLAYYSAVAPEAAPELAAEQYAIGMTFAGAAAFRSGGLIAKSFLGGGPVSGPGSSTSDSVPIWASNGEYMLDARTTSKLGVNTLREIQRNPEAWASIMNGAFLPPIAQASQFSRAGQLAGYEDAARSARSDRGADSPLFRDLNYSPTINHPTSPAADVRELNRITARTLSRKAGLANR